MNKIVAIGTSLLIFLQSINIHFTDLMELDQFMDHYRFHCVEYGDSFTVFVSKHYGELKTSHSEKHQEERKEHEKLPFQDQSHCAPIFVLNLDIDNFQCSKAEVPLAKKGNFHYQMSYSLLRVDGLFQPPKRA